MLSMFAIVLALERFDVTRDISVLLGNNSVIFKYGFLSFLSANILNNIPMSVAMSSVTKYLSSAEYIKVTYACIIWSDIGAYLAPLGALAGIMWSSILERAGVDFSFKKYVSYCVRISVPVMIAALAGLMISL